MGWPLLVSIRGVHRVLPPDQAAEGKGTVPPGGLAGQALAKLSGADYDAGWADAGGGGAAGYSAQNRDAADLAAGAPVATHPDGSGVLPALAADLGLPCVGLAAAALVAGDVGRVATAGTLTLADWSAVVGAATLAPRGLYFLDPATPGTLTLVPPAAAGQVLQLVGVAVAPETLAITLQQPILRG